MANLEKEIERESLVTGRGVLTGERAYLSTVNFQHSTSNIQHSSVSMRLRRESLMAQAFMAGVVQDAEDISMDGRK